MSQADWRSLYPFESHWHRCNVGRMHYLDEGPTGTQGMSPDASPPTLLFVHGNPTWSFHWRELVLRWRDRWRLVAPDHLGCGLSDKPSSGSYRFCDHVSRLAGFVEALDLRDVTLVVHDWGGPIGLAAALRMPERFCRYVLLNTGAFPPWYLPLRIRVCRLPLLGPLAVRGLNLFARAALRMTTCRRPRFSPAERAGYLAPYDSWANRIAIQRFVDEIPLRTTDPTWRHLKLLEAGLARLSDRPAMIVWGMRDWCFRPDCLDKLRHLLPQAQVQTVVGAGHWVVEDAGPEVASQIEEFVSAERDAAAASGSPREE